jgi:hypothetical protein
MQPNLKTSKTSIKIDSRFKGLNHYEDYLILKHKREIKLFLFEMDAPIPAKNKIWKLYSKRITRDNIKNLYTHTPMEFISHLIHNTLNELMSYTSITNLN